MTATEMLERLGLRRRSNRVDALPAEVQSQAVGDSELSRRRDELAKEFAELQWDIGGMVYEMASRDHFRLDVVNRHAARLQAIDAELSEVERLLRMETAGAAGHCPACGALHARNALYCWRCGKDLMAPTTVSGGTG
jgi:hypothetical protein